MIYKKIKQVIAISLGGSLVFSGLAIANGNEDFYEKIFMPCLFKLPPELAHFITLKFLEYGLTPQYHFETERLKFRIKNFAFENPIGLAAGCDKNGIAINGFFKIGFGFVEIGSITPLPQPGNDKPRMFRLIPDLAIINRLGFNNLGFNAVSTNLTSTNIPKTKILGVNIGKNKLSTELYNDYVKGYAKFASLADYLVINVSSPNTPGLRDLQKEHHIVELIRELGLAKTHFSKENQNCKVPLLFIKISPDMTQSENDSLIKAVLNNKDIIDGLIISNTTITRPKDLKSSFAQETGGLSGKPLKQKSTDLIKYYYKTTRGTIPIIGVGGIMSGQDAYDKIKAGASCVQLYTGLVYYGPPLVKKILVELDGLLEKDGYKNVSEAIGSDVKLINVVNK